MKNIWIVTAITLCLGGTAAAFGPDGAQSARLERAKDLIADEQWGRAIEQLKAAVSDAGERHTDEALFWLAHSQFQASDPAEAIETIARLEKQHPKSRWVRPARSLRIEIAQRLRRSDVLWWTAAPPQPAPRVAAPPAAEKPPVPFRAPRPSPPSATPPPTPPAAAPPPTPTAAATPAPPAPPSPAPSFFWIPEGWDPDTSLRIQALGSLMRTDAPRVIPMLREIALESPDPNEASRAVFLLAQSGKPEAHSTVVEVARHGSESVQIAAVRELGRFGGSKVAEELLAVYTSGNPRVKYQVVNSLGERHATTALMRIAETESDKRLQETALVRLGQAGGREQLQRFYTRARLDLKRPIIIGLFTARAEDELIQIAEQEKNEAIRQEVLTRLRLLNTEKARAYLEKVRKNR